MKNVVDFNTRLIKRCHSADVFSLCEKLCIQTYKYSESGELIHKLGLGNFTYMNDGFIVEFGLYLLIFYNDFLSPAEQKEIIAHELAHFLLDHPAKLKQLDMKTAELHAERYARILLESAK